jgi:hypothetical protein
MTRDITDFERPDLAQEGLEKSNFYLKQRGKQVRVICVARNYKEQIALYAQGREPLEDVNAKRAMAGLPKITKEENEYRVTWTLGSPHVVNLDDARRDNDKSRAFDFGLFSLSDGAYLKDDPDYIVVANIMSMVPGLKSGKDFKDRSGKPRPDYPHVEVAS